MLSFWENNDSFRGLFFAVVGLLLFTILFIWRRRIRSLRLQATEKTIATITNIRRRGKNGSVYQPVYAYYAEGQNRRVASRWASNIIVAEDGSEVELFYIPGQPEKIYVPKEQKTNWIPILFLSFIGTMFVVLGTAVAFGLIKA